MNTRACIFRSVFLALAVALVGSSSARAGTVGMEHWKVGPLRLGMTSDQAISVAQQAHWLGVGPVLRKAPCEQQRQTLIRTGKIRAGQPPLSVNAMVFGGECVYQAYWQPAGTEPATNVQLNFTEDYPSHPGVMRLTLIRLFVPTPTAADRTAFLAHVRKDFGPASPYLRADGSAIYHTPATHHASVAYASRACWTRLDSECLIPSQPDGFNPRGEIPDAVILDASLQIGGYGELDFLDGPRLLKAQAALSKAENAIRTTGMSF